jgi:hypothetical protein
MEKEVSLAQLSLINGKRGLGFFELVFKVFLFGNILK